MTGVCVVFSRMFGYNGKETNIQRGVSVMMMNWMSVLAETAGVVNDAAGATGDAAVPQSSGIIEMVVMMVAMIAIFYFLLIRPQRKKDKAVKKMLDALKPGDRICTIGGLYGTVSSIKDQDVTITLGAQQNTVVIARWAIRSVEDAPLENDAAPEI